MSSYMSYKKKTDFFARYYVCSCVSFLLIKAYTVSPFIHIFFSSVSLFIIIFLSSFCEIKKWIVQRQRFFFEIYLLFCREKKINEYLVGSSVKDPHVLS